GDADRLLGLEVGPGDKIYGVIDYEAARSNIQPFEINADGSSGVDYTGFSTGFASFADVRGVRVASDGKLLIFGKFEFRGPDDIGLPPDPNGAPFGGSAIVRWDADGSFDHSMGGTGFLFAKGADAGTLQPDNRILTAASAGTGKLAVRRRLYGTPDPNGIYLINGVLAVEGSPQADTIKAVQSGANIVLTARGATRTYARSSL